MPTFTPAISSCVAERAASSVENGPIFLTEEGARTHALLRSKKNLSIGELLSNPAAAKIEFDLPVRVVEATRMVDFD